MTESEAIVIVTREIKALSSNFVSDDYADAVDAAERETGFAFPATSSFQIQWLLKRTKRALFFSLLSENAESFKFKQISLQDKFKNLQNLVELMDKEFAQAQLDYIYEFAKVDAVQAFSHKIDAGFAYDDLGRDITYAENQLVGINPSSSDTTEG
jgi:hypothetical protein